VDGAARTLNEPCFALIGEDRVEHRSHHARGKVGDDVRRDERQREGQRQVGPVRRHARQLGGSFLDPHADVALFAIAEDAERSDAANLGFGQQAVQLARILYLGAVERENDVACFDL